MSPPRKLLDPEQGRHMRSAALGRVQASSELHRQSGQILTDAMRSFVAAGGKAEELALESGIEIRTIRAVIRGRGTL